MCRNDKMDEISTLNEYGKPIPSRSEPADIICWNNSQSIPRLARLPPLARQTRKT